MKGDAHVSEGKSIFVRRGGVALHAREWGAGSPLVLVHGLGTSSLLWPQQVAAFSGSRRVIAVDLRGFGRSDRPATPGAYAIPELAADVAAILSELGVDRADLLGASMGGFVAQTLALAQPGLVRSLMLCHTSARMSIPPDVVASRLAVLRSATMAAYGELVAGQALAPGGDPALRAWLVQMIAANDAHSYQQVLTEGLANFDVTERVHALRLPCLVLVGELDRVIPAVEGRALAKLIAGAELCEIRGVGHIGYAERPAEFNAAIAAFLSRVEGRSRA